MISSGMVNRRKDVNSRAAIAALVLAFAACAQGESNEIARTPGQALYTANCATCHGEQALGDGPIAASLPIEPPSLLEHLGHHPMDQLVQLIRSGLPPAMPPAALTDEEIRLVIDYTWTLVPDSRVAGLREMQRLAELGMPMDGTEMQTEGDSATDMSGMDHSTMDHSAHMTQPDTSGH